MRSSPRLYATVKSAVRYLEPNTPTGLTGLSTHPTPRPTLLLTYNQTLEKLKQIPASSVYRQSCEALTKQRLAIVEGTKPPGYDEWTARVKKVIESNPDAYGKFKATGGGFVQQEDSLPGSSTWDGKYKRKDAKAQLSSSQSEAEEKVASMRRDIEKVDKEEVEGVAPQLLDLEIEPSLTADQVSEIETKIAAGLIEEVIAVAEGELLLVDEMVASRAWEDLEEKSPPGQWEYFDRGDRV